MPRVPSFVCVKCEVKKEAEMFEGEIRGAHILYIHRCSALPFLPPHHVTVLIKNMLTHKPRTHLSPPPPLVSSPPLSLPTHPSLSPLSLDHRLPRSHYSIFLPPSPSFWRVGSSELVAVCIAKGNVSSTHRRKWVRTLERSLHMLSDTQCWGCVHEGNQITVSSLILCHT